MRERERESVRACMRHAQNINIFILENEFGRMFDAY